MGVNFYDTAIAYQSGTSEQYVGRALRDFAKRDEISYLEEPYVPHALAGVMAQTPKRAGGQSGGLSGRNKPANAKEKHVWSTGDQKINDK